MFMSILDGWAQLALLAMSPCLYMMHSGSTVHISHLGLEMFADMI